MFCWRFCTWALQPEKVLMIKSNDSLMVPNLGFIVCPPPHPCFLEPCLTGLISFVSFTAKPNHWIRSKSAGFNACHCMPMFCSGLGISLRPPCSWLCSVFVLALCPPPPTAAYDQFSCTNFFFKICSFFGYPKVFIEFFGQDLENIEWLKMYVLPIQCCWWTS